MPAPPSNCLICDDERQYVGWDGQEWLTLDDMRAAGYRNEIRNQDQHLTGIATEPRFAIGQRACLLQTPDGNLLWDPISYLDEQTVDKLRSLGGIQGIAASHPHFYGSMVEWSHAFDNAPIYIPEADRSWVPRPDPVIKPWSGSLQVFSGVTLIQCGGHFPGSTVVHWQTGADGAGSLLTGDSISVVQDRRSVTFMWSYPNVVPLSPSEVKGIVASVEPYEFERIYGAGWTSTVTTDAKGAIARSADRYIRHIIGEGS